jgi:hypothetical protein
MKLEVIKAYTRIHEYENPIAFRSGELLILGNRNEINSEWIWCIAPDASEGWVHETFLEIQSDEAIALRDYTAQELTVQVGEYVEDIECVGSWRCCQNAKRRIGWIPREHLSSLAVIRKRIEVHEQIETAFANVIKGNACSLRECEANDAGDDPKPYRALDLEERWQDLSDALIEQVWDAFIWTDPEEGVRFLMPAFMRYALVHLENYDAHDLAVEQAFNKLCGYHSSPPEDQVRWFGFRPEETKAIARFVRFYADHEFENHEQVLRWESLAVRV